MNPSDLPDETLFEGALKCRTPEERAAYLDQACADQPELRRKLEVLLKAHDQSGEFLEPTVVAARPTIKLDFAPEETSGTMIGRYKLLQKIGEGGMGVVYMAEQTEPVVRKVALKIIKLGMDTKQVVARFEAERQALALMDHPNIAKILDAGVTGAPVAAGILPAVEPGFQTGGKGAGSFGSIEQSEAGVSASASPGGRMPPSPAGETPAATLSAGRPYFVMELVHGVPITEYCDKNKLSTQQRLELFIPVCQAIQHAHQKGIIHRDIKPSNVMVTLHDGVPVPKVIDFGVAKATNQRLTEKTLFTHYAQMIGTPAYMSPEQAEMSGLDIDTRTDVYSLGVLLYELLTGSTPFDAKDLLSKGYAEMQRIIAQEEPPKPSTRMSTMHEEKKTVVAKNRGMDAGALRRGMQGDLDWIVMKCLEKDRTRRYETSNGLAADLRRHLSNELITARPPTTGYLIKKLIKRNKLAFASIGAVAVALILGLGLSTWQFFKERAARQRAVAAERQQEVLRKQAEELRAQAETQAYASDMAYASQAASVGSLGGVDRLLSGWRNHVPDLRGWEWYYLNGLCHQERLTIRADSNSVLSVAWSPDGKRLASGGRDRTVRIWDAATGRQIMSFAGHTGGVMSVAWSPDGKQLASSSSDKTVKVWDPELGTEIITCQGHSESVYCVAWSPDGQKLASCSSDETIRLWDAKRGTAIRTFLAQAQVWSVTWNTNGTRLASCGGGDPVQIWDALNTADVGTNQAQPGSLARQGGRNHAIAWSPNDQWLAVAGGAARIVDARSATNIFILDDHTSEVLSVAWSPDGMHLATASRGDGEIRIRNSLTRKAIRSFRGHLGAVRSLSWSPDGKQVASAGSDGTIKVWEVTQNDPIRAVVQRPGQIYSLAWHPDGRHLAHGNSENSVWVWDTTRMADPIHLGHTEWVSKVAWNPAGTRLAAGAFDGSIKLWDWPGCQEVLSVQAHPYEVRALAWSPDGRRFASLSGRERGLNIRGATTGSLVMSIPGLYGLALAWSPDGTQLAAGYESIIDLIDPIVGKEQARFTSHSGWIRQLAWSPDGYRLASASDDNTIKIWDMTARKELQTLIGHGTQVYSVDWSPDGTRVATADFDGALKIWNTASGRVLCSFSSSGAAVFSIAWNPDGRRIATANIHGEVVIYDATPGHLAAKRFPSAPEMVPPAGNPSHP